ncbi:hypothetical protein [Desulfovibrio sp. Fe33]|uniref:hypothetical protein n=1 Tax=Desulfovibrio sp. Fe33 TaxID=3020842 RepID=UPI00234CCD3B|nr:hypothetical protein [Desulfovibrio sp. Fe33]
MRHPNRFQAKLDSTDGAIVKDLKTSRTVAQFPPESDHKGMDSRYAEATAAEFNRLYGERLAALERMGR